MDSSAARARGGGTAAQGAAVPPLYALRAAVREHAAVREDGDGQLLPGHGRVRGAHRDAWGGGGGVTTTIDTSGNRLDVRFAPPFDLASYDLFLRTKELPESELAYEWETDTYTLTTAARYAGMLGREDLEPAQAAPL